MNEYFLDYIEESIKEAFNIKAYAVKGLADNDDIDVEDSVRIYLIEKNSYFLNLSKKDIEKEKYKDSFDYSIFPHTENNKKKYYISHLVYHSGSQSEAPYTDEIDLPENYDTLENAFKGVLIHILENKIRDASMYYWEREQEEYFIERHKHDN